MTAAPGSGRCRSAPAGGQCSKDAGPGHVRFAVLVAPDGRILDVLASTGACDARCATIARAQSSTSVIAASIRIAWGRARLHGTSNEARPLAGTDERSTDRPTRPLRPPHRPQGDWRRGAARLLQGRDASRSSARAGSDRRCDPSISRLPASATLTPDRRRHGSICSTISSARSCSATSDVGREPRSEVAADVRRAAEPRRPLRRSLSRAPDHAPTMSSAHCSPAATSSSTAVRQFRDPAARLGHLRPCLASPSSPPRSQQFQARSALVPGLGGRPSPATAASSATPSMPTIATPAPSLACSARWPGSSGTFAALEVAIREIAGFGPKLRRARSICSTASNAAKCASLRIWWQGSGLPKGCGV